MKKRLIFLLIVSIPVLINTIPLLIFKDNVSFSEYSAYPGIMMTIVSTGTLLVYDFRHKGNIFVQGRRVKVFLPDQEYTFTKEYSRTFYWQFTVRCSVIPFFIPCIFFTSKPIHLIWTVLIAFVVVITSIVYGIADTMKDVKEDKIVKQKLEQQLKEQQQKEELGRFK